MEMGPFTGRRGSRRAQARGKAESKRHDRQRFFCLLAGRSFVLEAFPLMTKTTTNEVRSWFRKKSSALKKRSALQTWNGFCPLSFSHPKQ
jgi:hypothetical protein